MGSASVPPSAHARGEKPVPPGPAASAQERPVFWKEVYWFALICLGGWILALTLLPGRLARHGATLDLEEELRASVTALAGLEKQYEAAIAAVENDPFYKEEVERNRLRVKRKGETLLREIPVGPARDPH